MVFRRVCIVWLSIGWGASPEFARADSVVEVEAYMASGLADGYGPGGKMYYNVGYTLPPGASETIERRNFMLFDLSGINKPLVSARLKMY